jgi:hypothetical protein
MAKKKHRSQPHSAERNPREQPADELTEEELDEAERAFLAEEAAERQKLRELAQQVPGPDLADPREKIWRYLIAEYGFDPRTLWGLSYWDMKRYIEARRPSQQNPIKELLLFDRDTLTVTLDGRAYPGLDPTAFSILEAIWKKRGKPVSSSDLLKEPGLKAKNLFRELKKLPEGLQAIIQGDTGSGRWICLPPQNSS